MNSEEMLAEDVTGAASTAAIIIYETAIVSGSHHKLDVLFIVTMTVFFVMRSILDLLIDNVHHDVAIRVQLIPIARIQIIGFRVGCAAD